MKELTEKQAIELAKTEFWEDMSSHDIVKFQLFEKRSCMPFGVFHKAITEELGRPVYIHEFGLNLDGLKSEFLGAREAPSLEDIINLIPEEKRLTIKL